MVLGYIVNDTHPLLKTISDSEIKEHIGTKPILIIGYEKASSLYPNVSFDNKVIDKENKVYYALSKTESESKHIENVINFLCYAFNELLANYTVHNIVKLNTLAIKSESVFIYETDSILTLTTATEIYYLNKSIVDYFEGVKKTTTENIINYLPPGIEIISWDTATYFGAYLKANRCYKSKEQINALLDDYGDIDLYMGALCLNWMKELKYDDSVKLWTRAYEVENYLSKIKIKIDEGKLEKLNEGDNVILNNIQDKIFNGHIIQKYNGTDKVTGRIYAISSGFSLQTLTKNFKEIIVAEDNCLLLEFDYKYFEYYLLSQIIDFPIDSDPHSSVSKLIFGTDEHRDIAKTINYGLLYGKSLDNTIEELYRDHVIQLSKETLKDKLLPIVNAIEIFSDQLIKRLKKEGYISNYFGRQITPEKIYASFNNYIQSTAADFVIIKIKKLADYLSKKDPLNRIVLQNHDSILLNLKLEDIENTEMAIEIKALLESPERKLIAKVGLKYGANWKELS